MGLPDGYLITTKNLESLLNAIQSAQAPDKFSHKFLEQLDFSSSNDRLYIKILKDLGFLDDMGTPLERYHKFLDASESKRVMAGAIKRAYSDLFAIRKDAWKMSEDEVMGKLKTLTQGKKTELVIKLMAKTFKALCEYADWTADAVPSADPALEVVTVPSTRPSDVKLPDDAQEKLSIKGGLHYNIQIYLPESRDPKVYDAIFDSMRRHLL
jgi:hypothetical protein